MSWNIPIAFVAYQRKGGRFEYGPRMNPYFVAHVLEVAAPTDVLLVTCRSGGRSALAVNALAAAGFKTPTTSSTGWKKIWCTIPTASLSGRG